MRPSVLTTPLLRGHVILKTRLPCAGIPWCPFPSRLFSSPLSCDEPSASVGVSDEDRRNSRKWNIPWGLGPGGEPLSLVRELQTLPGIEEPADESGTFRVMSFNMLAQGLACSEYFPYVAKGELKRKKRMPRVTEEISRYGADIICLQECDAFDAVLESLREERAPQGAYFEGVHKNSKGKEHGVAVLFDSKVFRMLDSGSYDFGPALNKGAGVFVLLEVNRYRPHAAELVEHDARAAEQGGPRSREDGPQGGVVDERGLPRAEKWGRSGGDVHGGDVEGPEDAKSKACRTLCVATTHLYWHPAGDGIRLAQAEALMESMKAFLHSHFGDEASSVPVVLAGDLNTVPGVGVYRLLAAGSCTGETPEMTRRRIGSKKVAGTTNMSKVGGEGRAEELRTFRQDFEDFRSAYGSYCSVFGSQLGGLGERSLRDGISYCPTSRRRTVGHVQLGARGIVGAPSRSEREVGELAVDGAEGGVRIERMASGEPELTSCTGFFAAAIDYIWHTPHLEVRSLLGLPSLEQAMQDGGLPSANYPSDHLSIVAELRWSRGAGGTGLTKKRNGSAA